MDFAAKRRQLEELRAAREAKQRSLQQHHQQSSATRPAIFSRSDVVDVPGHSMSLTSSLFSRGDGRVESLSSISREPTNMFPPPLRVVEESPARSFLLSGNAVALSRRRSGAGLNDMVSTPQDAAISRKNNTSLLQEYVDQKSMCVKSDHEGDDNARDNGISCVEDDFSSITANPSPAVALSLIRSFPVADGCRGRCVVDIAVLRTGTNSLAVAAALSDVDYGDKDSVPFSHSLTSGSVGARDVTASAAFSGSGLVLLWNISLSLFETGPAVFLGCGSAVRCLVQSRHRPHCLFGGTSSGRVVLWRTDEALSQVQPTRRSGQGISRGPLAPLSSASSSSAAALVIIAPCEQSFPSPHAHQSPVLAMAVHGDASYHHLYTCSEEGRVCMWSPNTLWLPSSSRDASGLAGAACCAAFVDRAADAMSKILVGCLDGRLLEGRARSARAVELREWTSAPHFSAIVAVAPHPLHPDPRVSDTAITVAADGSAALWLGEKNTAIDGFAGKAQCLRWSPTHAAVFVAGESGGRVAAWNLTQSASSPVAFAHLRSATAVTSVAFADDGVWLTCGTADGEVHLLRLRDDLVTEPLSDNRDGIVSAASSWIDARFA